MLLQIFIALEIPPACAPPPPGKIIIIVIMIFIVDDGIIWRPEASLSPVSLQTRKPSSLFGSNSMKRLATGRRSQDDLPTFSNPFAAGVTLY